MTPRVGDVVRHYGHNVIARVVSIEYDNRPLYNLSVNGYDGILEGELEVLTVSELFEAAGHPVPHGNFPLLYDDVDDNWYRPDFVWFDGDRWVVETDGPDRVKSPDLSRLPAGDAWDALPDVVKAVVK